MLKMKKNANLFLCVCEMVDKKYDFSLTNSGLLPHLPS